MRSYLSAGLGAPILLFLLGFAQVPESLSGAEIQEAIRFGTAQKNLELYKLQAPARWGWPPRVGGYTTPFLRVALAAHEAKKRYLSFDKDHIDPEMIAPEVHVIAGSQKLEGAAIANVATIVVLPKGTKDRAQAIQPTRVEPLTEEYKNLAGFTGEGRGLLAVFPLSVLNEDNEFHVVFDREIPSARGPGSNGGCEDCTVPIRLKGIR